LRRALASEEVTVKVCHVVWFSSVEQLDDGPGIGPAIYAELADLVRV
jgi:hypothetical protein